MTFTSFCHDLLALWYEAPGLFLVQAYIAGMVLLARRQVAQNTPIRPDSEA